jgi:hypothetical protein
VGVVKRDGGDPTGREREVDVRAYQEWVDSEIGSSRGSTKLDWLPDTSGVFLSVFIAALIVGVALFAAPFVYGVVKAADPDRGANRVHAYPTPGLHTHPKPPTRAEQEAQLDLRSSLAAPAQVAIPLVALAAFGLLYLVFGREPRTCTWEYVREPLDDIAPALVAWVWDGGRVGGSALVATIMDLVDRGILTAELEPSARPATGAGRCLRLAEGDGGRVGDLRLEPSAMLLLFTADGRRGSLTTDELQDLAAHSARFSRGARWWRDDVRADAFDRGLVNIASVRASWIAVGVGLLAMWLSMVVYGYYSPTRWNWWTFAGVVAGATIVLLARRIVSRTREAADLHARCAALRRYLHDFGRLDEYPAYSVAVWRRFLVMAVALGVADETMREFTGRSGVRRDMDDSVAVWEEFEEWSPQAVFDEIF